MSPLKKRAAAVPPPAGLFVQILTDLIKFFADFIQGFLTLLFTFPGRVHRFKDGIHDEVHGYNNADGAKDRNDKCWYCH